MMGSWQIINSLFYLICAVYLFKDISCFYSIWRLSSIACFSVIKIFVAFLGLSVAVCRQSQTQNRTEHNFIAILHLRPHVGGMRE